MDSIKRLNGKPLGLGTPVVSAAGLPTKCRKITELSVNRPQSREHVQQHAEMSRARTRQSETKRAMFCAGETKRIAFRPLIVIRHPGTY